MLEQWSIFTLSPTPNFLVFILLFYFIVKRFQKCFYYHFVEYGFFLVCIDRDKVVFPAPHIHHLRFRKLPQKLFIAFFRVYLDFSFRVGYSYHSIVIANGFQKPFLLEIQTTNRHITFLVVLIIKQFSFEVIL